MYALVGLGATVSGIAITFKKIKSVFGNATNTLQSTNAFSTKLNKDVNDVADKISALDIKYNEAIGCIKATQEANEKIFNEKLNEIKEIIERLEPLLKLPVAFSEYVSQDPKAIKTGLAKRVNTTLGVNKDNIQKANETSIKDKVGE